MMKKYAKMTIFLLFLFKDDLFYDLKILIFYWIMELYTMNPLM